MNTKHTTKPWEWERIEDEGKVTEWSLKGPTKVLCRFWYDGPPEQDALLIAAAPDLLEALTETVSVLHYTRDNVRPLSEHEDRAVEGASKAITKATKEV